MYLQILENQLPVNWKITYERKVLTKENHPNWKESNCRIGNIFLYVNYQLKIEDGGKGLLQVKVFGFS